MKIAIIAILAAGFVGVASLAGCGGAGGGAYAPPARDNTRSVSRDTTPTPTPTPIQLVQGGVVGTPTFPEGDTATGGQGQQVAGVNCRQSLNNLYHHHVHLSMFVNGTQIALPRGTGMKNPGTNSFVYHADCFYFLHTHDATGIIHIEPPTGSTYNLHQYFKIWGEPLSTNGFAGFTGPVAVYIDGTLQPGVDPNTVAFSPYEEITLVIGTPPDWIPNYLFPAGYP